MNHTDALTSHSGTSSAPQAGDAGGPLTGHAYDGIQEYDNPLPGWWKWFFVGTIVFSVLYWMFFHFGASERTMFDYLSADEAALAKKQYGTLGELTQDRATLVRFAQEKDWLQYGKSIFRTNCQSCHGPDGGGLVGPNLTDAKWKNVRHIEDIMKVVNNGAGNNAMPPWKQRFSDPRDVIMVSAYVASLLGTTPATGKGPEGLVDLANWDADFSSVANVKESADKKAAVKDKTAAETSPEGK